MACDGNYCGKIRVKYKMYFSFNSLDELSAKDLVHWVFLNFCDIFWSFKKKKTQNKLKHLSKFN